MLVDTPFETVSQLENVVQKYVNNKIEYRSKEVLVNDFTLEDVRLELSSSARKHTFIVDKAVKQPNESFVSDIHIKPLNMDILDIIPLDLREQFKYEQGMTDASRTQLLQKNLTIVTLIQDIQNQLKEDEVSVEDEISVEDDSLVEPTEFEISAKTDVQVNTLVDTSTPISTEIEDFSLEDDLESIEEQSTQEIDDFSLDSDEDISNSLDNFSQIDDFSLDDEEEPESTVLDNEQTEGIDDFVLDETEPTVDDFSLDEEEEPEEEETDNEEPKLDDFTLEEITTSKNTEDFSLEGMKEPSDSVVTPIVNETTNQPLSDLELFKQAIGDVKESVPKVKKPRTNVDDEEPIIEDLDSISEDELDTDDLLDTADIDTAEDLSDTDEDETDIEDESDEFDEFEDADSEIDSSSDSISSTETDIEEGDSEDLEDIEWNADDEIGKTEDNVEFTDTTSVNITKVDTHTERPAQTSEWGKSLEQRANNSLGSQSGTQDFKQQFDKEEDKDELVAPEQVTKAFVENISREEKPVARAPSQASVTQDKQELPPLRMYLKKHAYTPIQTLIEMGYSDMEIKDGIKRGRFIIKRGTLRALY